MISAEEALIAFLRADAGLDTATNSQIANLHHYGQDGGDWPPSSAALTIGREGGEAQTYLESDRANYTVRCYGATPQIAMGVYQAFLAIVRDFERTAVAVTGGNGLIYYIVVASQPTADFDEELDVYMYQILVEADVAEIAVI